MFPEHNILSDFKKQSASNFHVSNDMDAESIISLTGLDLAFQRLGQTTVDEITHFKHEPMPE